MADLQDRIDQLNKKLEALLSKQEYFAQELMAVYKEIEEVKKTISPGVSTPAKDASNAAIQKPETATSKQVVSQPVRTVPSRKAPEETKNGPSLPKTGKERIKTDPLRGKSNWEKFIGENLTNKIGILITVLGVAIGAKYSIENNLISPLTRIVLGYLAGVALIGVGIRLKAKYANYSAVLVGG
ncbi:MAG: DUF2339 domain-containing protein, partial [Bacteroidota bacterium]